VRCGTTVGRRRPLTGAEQGGCLLRLLTGRGRCSLCQPTSHLPDTTPADRVAVVAVAGLWPGHQRWRAVIVKPGQGELASGLDVAGAEGAHDVTAPGTRVLPAPALQLAVRAGGFHRIPGTPSTNSAMSTTAMMVRAVMIGPMRTMARSLPVNPGVAGRRRRLIPGASSSAYTGSKKLAIYF
jgi:hypothetical protein